jgi:hypothetical protein
MLKFMSSTISAIALLLAFQASSFAALVSDDVTYDMLHGTFQIKNASILSVSDGSIFENPATVSKGASINLLGDWSLGAVIDDSNCIDCVIQTYIAWISPAKADGATPSSMGLWSGISNDNGQSGGTSGSFDFTTFAPTIAGDYFIGLAQTLDFGYLDGRQGYTGADTANGTSNYASFKVTVVPESVPEPSVIALLALGFVGIAFSRRRQS